MPLEGLQIQRFRCIQDAKLEVDLDENLIFGQNASGKTSILEAIYFLGHGRSFRSANQKTLINDNSEHLTVFARVTDPNGKIGVQVGNNGLAVKIDGTRVHSRSSLVTRLPTQVIEPGIHKLIEEGPDQRRKYLDWGVFHVEQRFHSVWRRYRKALIQRNTALKERVGHAELSLWEETLIGAGEAVNEHREQYLHLLEPFLRTAGEALFDTPLECQFAKGWPESTSLAQAMDDNREKDRRLFRTHAGPHRADIKIRLLDKIAKARVSRGQQKLLAAGLVLAQLSLFADVRQVKAILLLDDPAAELDANSLERLLVFARTIPAQRFITALDLDLIAAKNTKAVFHVEHGVVQKMV